MAILRLLALSSTLGVGACYAPELRDCAVTCTSAADCAPSQVCGEDRWCAAPEIAGRCALPDAGTAVTNDAPADDDAPVDAPAPDAPGPVILVIQIMGHGAVAIANVGTCNDHAPNHQCTYAVMGGTTLELVATGTEGNTFEKWVSVACTLQDESCTLTPTASSTTVVVKFH